jgi:hypothetical protein
VFGENVVKPLFKHFLNSHNTTLQQRSAATPMHQKKNQSKHGEAIKLAISSQKLGLNKTKKT